MTDQATFEMIRPDDWHVHFRDSDVLKAVAPLTAQQFGRGIIMPNLKPPITTTADAKLYHKRIKHALPKGSGFRPLMTCFLTDKIDVADVTGGFRQGVFTAVKLYPAGATTNSAAGLTDWELLFTPGSAPCQLLEAMQENGWPLCVHGEVVERDGKRVDPFDRESVFVHEILPRIRRTFPDLGVILEHVSTIDGVEAVRAEDVDHVAATITVHHAWANREDLMEGGLRPHLYCLPVVKRREHQLAVRAAMVSGDPRFFAGTDSAPHSYQLKESVCCPGGMFTAHAAVELYAQIFWEERGVLDSRFEEFMSVRGARFYGLEANKSSIRLVREPWKIDSLVAVGSDGDYIRPFGYDENPKQQLTLEWRVAN